MSEKLKVAIIGCGGIANGKHLPALKENKDLATIIATCDLIPERAEKAKEEYGTPDTKVFVDYHDVLALKPDAVFVLTPNRWHSEISVAALEAGINVMCEKPMAINYEEALKMVNAAKKSGKLLTIGYQSRYRSDLQYLKKVCDDGELGEIYYAKAIALRRRGVPTWGVFLDEYAQGGGPLIDIATHSLDLTLWLMNNYEPAYCVGTTYHKLNNDTDQGNPWGNWDPEKFTVEDSAFGFVVMKNGATVNVSASWALNTLESEEVTAHLCGTKAGADTMDGVRINGIKNNCQYVLKPTINAKGADFYEGAGSGKPYVIENRVFLNAVLGKGGLTVLPEQAACVTRILEGIYASAASGKAYYFE